MIVDERLRSRTFPTVKALNADRRRTFKLSDALAKDEYSLRAPLT